MVPAITPPTWRPRDAVKKISMDHHPSVASHSFKLPFKLIPFYPFLTSPHVPILFHFTLVYWPLFPQTIPACFLPENPLQIPSSLCSTNPVPGLTSPKPLLKWLSHCEVFFGPLRWQKSCCRAAWIFPQLFLTFIHDHFTCLNVIILYFSLVSNSHYSTFANARDLCLFCSALRLSPDM